jgi:DNA phosphorothioation-associated putative methyltransferase
MAEVRHALALDLDVHDHQLGLALQRADLGHDIGRAALALWQIDKHLGVAKRHRRQVYLALAAFDGRPKFTGLPLDVQYDVKAFFGSYKEACAAADAVLFRAGDQAAINRACQQSQVGKLTRQALYVHASALDRLSPLLRVYEGCGRTLTGTVEGATIIKLNYIEPKVSYLMYPDFDRDPHPALAVSVRADLQRLHVKVRDFHTHANPPILHRKETFVASDYPGRDKFMRLTAQEERHGLLSDPAAVGTRDHWMARVSSKGLRFRGHRLVRQ